MNILTTRDIIIATFVFLGAVIMFLSILKTRGILGLLKANKLIRYWQLLIWLMIFFLGGYLATVEFVLARLTEILLILIGVVFFGGAIFVYLVVQLGHLTISDILKTITERKRAEDELRQHRDQLEEIVAERTAALVTANAQLQQEIVERKQAEEKAEAANRVKSVFLANMSHELRTPLNAILGFSHLMDNNPDLPPEHKKNLDTITRSGERLLTLINRLLELSAIEIEHATLDEQILYQEIEERAARDGQKLKIQNLKPKIIILPPDLLANLEQATIRIDVDKVGSLIDEVRTHNANLADELATLADDFRYDEILALIQEARA